MANLIPEQGGFTNFGDWLIQRSSGVFGDFKMDVCLALMRTERYARGWVDALTPDDIKRVLARYKEHVGFWNISATIVQGQLAQFADALRKDQNTIFFDFNQLPASRFPPAQSVGELFCRIWKNHVVLRPNLQHQPDLRRESGYSFILYCVIDGETLGRSNVLDNDHTIVHNAFSICISRP